MSSNIFSGIYRANDALTAARYGLDVTGQNIANANTPGYTRQASQQTSVETAVGVPTLHSGTVENGGVRAIGAQRLADLVLDSRMRDEHARSAQVGTQATEACAEAPAATFQLPRTAASLIRLPSVSSRL